MNKSSRELNKCIRSLFDEGVDKFDLKECVEEYYKNDESYEYCEEMLMA